jgi:hypothetical protein
LADVSSCYVVAATSDSALIVWNHGGMRVLPPVIMETTLSQLSIREHLILCLTQHGSLWLLDLKTKKIILQRVPLSPILTGDQSSNFSISSISITESMLPVISLSDHKLYVYHPQLTLWQRVGASETNIRELSEIYNGANILAVGDSEFQFTMKSQEAKSNEVKKALKRLSSRAGADAVKWAVLADLEEKIALAASERSVQSFRSFVLSYASKLGDMNEDVMTSSFDIGNVQTSLLEEAISLLSRNRYLQTVLVDYFNGSAASMGGVSFT